MAQWRFHWTGELRESRGRGGVAVELQDWRLASIKRENAPDVPSTQRQAPREQLPVGRLQPAPG